MKPNEKLDPAVKWLFYNRDRVSEWFGETIYHTPPSSNAEHYPHKYKWDILFSTIIKARKGYSEDAAIEIEDLFDGQKANGLVPSPQFLSKGRENDLERAHFMDPQASDYGQPTIEALASIEIYQGLAAEGKSVQAALFLKDIYPKLAASYEYYARERSHSSHNPLIFNTHPHETGRDSDPTFDYLKIRLPRFGKRTPRAIDAINRVTDYASVIALGVAHWLDEWKTEKTRERFEVYDVMFNCMYYDNLAEMSKLAELRAEQCDGSAEQTEYIEQAERFKTQVNEVQRQILEQMWFEDEGEKGLFLALRPEEPIEEVSVSNLFPLVLPDLKEVQLEAILDLIENNFITPEVRLPIPSVPPVDPFTGKPNSNYDPTHSEWDRIWRGSTWINMNWYLVERGLAVQADRTDLLHRPDLMERCNNLIRLISERSYKVVEGVGLWEFYGPEDTRPQRTNRSPTFAWSALAYLLKDKYSAELD